jgi:1-acyl-sn-glycerol-3-phosphate acyltransferase
MNSISRFIFCKLWGWKITGEVKVPKFVVAVIPHTSNWDFIVGLFLRSASNINHCRYVGKSSLFVFPFGYLFRALGGIPVDRTKTSNFVQAVANLFPQHEKLGICLSPEGTRSPVTQLKTGFYYIAKTANVPLILCKFDWGIKTIDYSDPFYLTDDMEADMKFIINHFQGVQGRNYPFEM